MISDGSEVGRVNPNAPLGLDPTHKPLPQRQRLYPKPPNWVPDGEVFFITICCAERRTNELALPEPFRVLTTAIEHYQATEKMWAYLFFTMPDHLHALLSFPPAAKLEAVLRDWKRYVAQSAGITWQDDFFDYHIRNNESLEEKAAYIRLRPGRAGLVAAASRWNFVWPDCHAAPTR